MLSFNIMKNSVVLITGSSRGIGRETACLFAGEKAKVIVTYCHDRAQGEESLRKCRERGATEALLVHLDVMDNRSMERALERVISKFKKIDILINNCGVIAWKPLKEQSLDEIELQVRANLEGLIKVTKLCIPHIKEMIINIASGAGQTGYADLTTYCATKFGVRGFTQALAAEVMNLRIYAFNPDMTATKMTNFEGRPPEDVARIILNTAKGMYAIPHGGDINIWDHLK